VSVRHVETGSLGQLDVGGDAHAGDHRSGAETTTDHGCVPRPPNADDVTVGGGQLDRAG